ncbi:hypothetical protein BJV78DRAFT_1157733 [Lactifluus subvellereus]|nr:hypothetical protein BJV78DRAFT_1157733 [Lactifluus subvellereus]
MLKSADHHISRHGTRQRCNGQLTYFSVGMTYSAFDGAKRDFSAHTVVLVLSHAYMQLQSRSHTVIACARLTVARWLCGGRVRDSQALLASHTRNTRDTRPPEERNLSVAPGAPLHDSTVARGNQTVSWGVVSPFSRLHVSAKPGETLLAYRGSIDTGGHRELAVRSVGPSFNAQTGLTGSKGGCSANVRSILGSAEEEGSGSVLEIYAEKRRYGAQAIGMSARVLHLEGLTARSTPDQIPCPEYIHPSNPLWLSLVNFKPSQEAHDEHIGKGGCTIFCASRREIAFLVSPRSISIGR